MYINQAEMLAIFVFSAIPEELTVSEAESVLIASGELDCITAGECIAELVKRGSLYVVRDEKENESYIGITEEGEEAAETFRDRREHLSSAINRALRRYRKIVTGVDYIINVDTVKEGSFVDFERRLHDEVTFSVRLRFEKCSDALETYIRMEKDPDSFYKGFMTVATGKTEYLM